ncbi:Phosphatase yihX [uncultured Clostridium sp.]|nr:Phosphatase yihX [uncultured Clostridium sp.]
MIDTVIFDIGKVLMGYSWEKYLHSIVGEDKIAYATLEQAIFLSPCWEEHDKGLMTEEEELWDFISNAPDYEPEIRAVYENLGQCTWPYDYADAWVKELKDKGLKVYALSNWPKHIYDQRRHVMTFLDQMDGCDMSYRTHSNKPNPEAFTGLFEHFGIDPEKAVFIDDNADNIEAAKRLGLHAIRFASYEQAKEELNQLL